MAFFFEGEEFTSPSSDKNRSEKIKFAERFTTEAINLRTTFPLPAAADASLLAAGCCDGFSSYIVASRLENPLLLRP